MAFADFISCELRSLVKETSLPPALVLNEYFSIGYFSLMYCNMGFRDFEYVSKSKLHASS